jgi:hypothetical protein
MSPSSAANVSAFIAKIVNPIVWRIPGHAARKLFEFSLAEHGSMLDLKAAARLTPSVERRAAYVRHLIDETRHAQVFALRSAELRRKAGLESFGSPSADTEDLFENLGEVRFLAFVHRGECRGRRQFETYRDWFAREGDDKSRALFEAIVRDERQHESYTWELLVELTGGVSAAKMELRKASLWEAWRLWRRAGRFIAEKVYFLLMLVLYATLAPFRIAATVMRPARAGWVVPLSEIEEGAAPPRQIERDGAEARSRATGG